MVEFVILSSELSETVLKSKIDKILNSLSEGESCGVAVTPRFLECAAVCVSHRDDITISSLSLFAAQTYTEVAILEVAMALENGADRIEIPMNTGLINEGNFAELQSRVEVISNEIGDSAELSLFIDSSKILDFELFSRALIVGVEAGASTIALNYDKCDEVKFLNETLCFVQKYRGDVKVKVVLNSSIETCKADVQNFIAKCGVSESALCVAITV